MQCECKESEKSIVHEVISTDYVRNKQFTVSEYKCKDCGLYGLHDTVHTDLKD